VNLSVFRAAEEVPERTFLVGDSTAASFGQVAEIVERVITWLHSQGVRPGQRRPVAIDAASDERTTQLLLALLELRVTALLLHPRWTREERIRALELTNAVALAPPESFATGRGTAPPAALGRVGELDVLGAAERPALIVCTSGTSGEPKAVALSRAALCASAHASSAVLGWQEDDRWLLSLVLAHVGGLSIVTRCLAARRTIVFSPQAPQAAFDAARIRARIEDSAITLLSLVPAQLARLLELGGRCPPSVRAVLLGGAGAPAALRRRALAARWPIHCTYGLTEACSQVTVERSPGSDSASGGAGSPLPGVEVRIDGGRIAFKSPALFGGYLGRAEPNPNPGQWWRTADCGEFDNGQLRVLGRADDAIITGGENVHPADVEHQLLEHPAISEACVFGVPDDDWGQIVAAAIVTAPGTELTALEEWTRQHMASFKRPRRFVCVDALPLTASGKLDRAALQSHFAELASSMLP
jgi:O-succinylbenzoic acid--CoA ligase